MRIKYFLSIIITFLSLQELVAQEKYVDSIYPVKAAETFVYATKDAKDLIIDLYQPETGNQEKNPLIIFMHGGGFSGGSPKNPQEVNFAKIAASKGYTVGLISYRLTRKGKSFGCDFEAEGKIKTFRLAAEDFMDAVKFMQSNSDKFNIDPEKIIVGGSSAGAEAVLNAVYNPDLMFENDKYSDIKISAVISLAGAILDVRYLNEKNAVPGIFFHGTDDNLVPYGTAPHHYCENTDPGYLILDGSKTIVDRLDELHASYLFYTVLGARHEISGMPFDDLPPVFEFLKAVVFKSQTIQTKVEQ